MHQWTFKNNGIVFRDEDWSRLKKIGVYLSIFSWRLLWLRFQPKEIPTKKKLARLVLVSLFVCMVAFSIPDPSQDSIACSL